MNPLSKLELARNMPVRVCEKNQLSLSIPAETLMRQIAPVHRQNYARYHGGSIRSQE